MSSLSAQIKQLLPIDNEYKLDELFSLLKRRNTCIDASIDAKVLSILPTTRLKESYCRRTGRKLSNVQMPGVPPIIGKVKKKDSSELYRGGLESSDPLMKSYEKQKLYEQRRSTSHYDRFEYGISDW